MNNKSDDVREKVLDAIREALPGAFFRIGEQNVYSSKTVYNKLSNGTGPPVVEIRGQKYLERDSFMAWLAGTPAMKRGRKRRVV